MSMVLLKFVSILSGSHPLPVHYVSALFSDIVRLKNLNAHIRIDPQSLLSKLVKWMETEHSRLKSVNVHFFYKFKVGVSVYVSHPNDNRQAYFGLFLSVISISLGVTGA